MWQLLTGIHVVASGRCVAAGGKKAAAAEAPGKRGRGRPKNVQPEPDPESDEEQEEADEAEEAPPAKKASYSVALAWIDSVFTVHGSRMPDGGLSRITCVHGQSFLHDQELPGASWDVLVDRHCYRLPGPDCLTQAACIRWLIWYGISFCPAALVSAEPWSAQEGETCSCCQGSA